MNIQGDMSFLEMTESVLDQANIRLLRTREDPGEDGIWEVHDPEMAPDFLLSCPCGQVIEQDGQCPNGHVSPLRAAGLA